ncbi:MAG: BrnT family toxin [Candidatus Bipolaricaulota bacterium]|nr:BrnT family toxin [Candidatus Bipolaricaulota bacterium]
MEFEFDPAKSAANEVKHGIDFAAAQALWDDPDVIEIPARTSDEPRWVIVGRIGDVHWSAIITRREERIRVISVRRSRREEVSWVEGEES